MSVVYLFIYGFPLLVTPHLLERLRHLCLSVSIYTTLKCWINSLAGLDLSCFITSFEPHVSSFLPLTWSTFTYVYFSLMMCLVCTLLPCWFSFTLTEGNEKYEEPDRDGWAWWMSLIFPPLSLVCVNYISMPVLLTLNLYPDSSVTLAYPAHYSVQRQAPPVVLRDDWFSAASLTDLIPMTSTPKSTLFLPCWLSRSHIQKVLHKPFGVSWTGYDQCCCITAFFLFLVRGNACLSLI